MIHDEAVAIINGPRENGAESGVVQSRVRRDAVLTVVGRIRARCFFRWWCEYEAMRWRGSETAGKCS
jgi:hypothetical protein